MPLPFPAAFLANGEHWTVGKQNMSEVTLGMSDSSAQ